MSTSAQKGRFITLEGMDGAGKSTHIPNVIKQIELAGYTVVSTREPGGTPVGEALREILLHQDMDAETETLLMFAARKEHIAKVIAPALSQGQYVVCDRFTDASYAYQAGAKGVSDAKMQSIENWVQEGLQPDLTLLFDVPVEVSVSRLAKARVPDKFERESEAFFEKLRAAYLARAEKNPDRFHVINANQALDTVAEEVKVIIENFIATN